MLGAISQRRINTHSETWDRLKINKCNSNESYQALTTQIVPVCVGSYHCWVFSRNLTKRKTLNLINPPPPTCSGLTKLDCLRATTTHIMRLSRLSYMNYNRFQTVFMWKGHICLKAFKAISELICMQTLCTCQTFDSVSPGREKKAHLEERRHDFFLHISLSCQRCL